MTNLFKKIGLISVLGISLVTLTGCNGTIDPAVVSVIQQDVVAACNFLPTVNTIIQILNKQDPNVTKGTDIAKAVCVAVVPGGNPSAPTLVAPMVDGVLVIGKFLK